MFKNFAPYASVKLLARLSNFPSYLIPLRIAPSPLDALTLGRGRLHKGYHSHLVSRVDDHLATLHSRGARAVARLRHIGRSDTRHARVLQAGRSIATTPCCVQPRTA